MTQSRAFLGVPICFSKPLLTWIYFICLNRGTGKNGKNHQIRRTKGTSKLQRASNTVFLKETDGKDRETRIQGKTGPGALVPVKEDGRRNQQPGTALLEAVSIRGVDCASIQTWDKSVKDSTAGFVSSASCTNLSYLVLTRTSPLELRSSSCRKLGWNCNL